MLTLPCTPSPWSPRCWPLSRWGGRPRACPRSRLRPWSLRCAWGASRPESGRRHRSWARWCREGSRGVLGLDREDHVAFPSLERENLERLATLPGVERLCPQKCHLRTILCFESTTLPLGLEALDWWSSVRWLFNYFSQHFSQIAIDVCREYFRLSRGPLVQSCSLHWILFSKITRPM